MTLYWDRSGPLLRYASGRLQIEDLNPHITTQWRMSCWEMVWLGLRCIVAALRWR